MTGSILLVIAAFAGFLLVPFQNADILYRELNTKQSYMLFLIPRSSKSILGAKLLNAVIWLAVQGAVMGLFFCVDAAVLYSGFGDTEGLVGAFLASTGNGGSTVSDFVLFAALVIATVYGFVLSVLTAFYFAEVVQASVLNGRKGGAWFALLIFVILLVAIIIIIGRVTAAVPASCQAAAAACMEGVFIILFFLAASGLMEKRLSV